MASTYTDLLRIEKQADGENDSTWGSKTNTNFEMFEDAIAGRAAITHSDAASYTLTTANAATDEARNMILNIGGALTAARNTVVPTASKLYVAKNATTGGFATTLKTTAGTGIAIPNGNTTLLFCDGTNVVSAIDYLPNVTVGGVILAAAGVVGAPSYSFSADADTGFYSNALSQVTFASDGVGTIRFGGGGGFVALSSTTTFGWTSGLATAGYDLILNRDAANTLALRNLTNAQALRAYNTFTDASNYERLLLGWSANAAFIKTENAGTGGARQLILSSQGSSIRFDTNNAARWQMQASGDLIASTDNSWDIGNSGALRPRSLYWGTQALGPDGTATNPSFAFASSTNTGLITRSAGTMDIVTGGVSRLVVDSGAQFNFGNGTIAFAAGDPASNLSDTKLVRDAANVFAQRNTTTAQTFRVYNTFTDASNYERGFIRWSSNVLEIGGEAAGTGTARVVRFMSPNNSMLFSTNGTDRWGISSSTGHFLAQTDNTFDIGAVGATRPRDLFLGRSITIGGASMVQNSQSAAYTTVAADANKHILHPTADNNARTFTIDSNANVAYTIGACITFVNQINVVTIAITSDTLTLAGAGTTGSRTLAANGIATAIKVAATSWVISGTGLT